MDVIHYPPFQTSRRKNDVSLKKITEKHEGDQGPKRGEKESSQLVLEQNELWTTLCLVVEIL